MTIDRTSPKHGYYIAAVDARGMACEEKDAAEWAVIETDRHETVETFPSFAAAEAHVNETLAPPSPSP